MLDLTTAAIFAVSLSIIQTIVTYLFAQLARTYQGAIMWATASALAILGNLLYGLRGVIPDFASIVIANGINIFALWCLYYGVRQFLKISASSHISLLLLSLPLLTVLLIRYFQNDIIVRSSVMSVMILIFMSSTVYLLWVQSPTRGWRSHQFTRLVFMGFALFNILRLIPFVGTEVSDTLKTDFIVIVPLLGSSVFGIMWTAGIGLMLNEQLVADLQFTATHDFLTNTLNRRAIQPILENEFHMAQQHSTPLSVMLLDVDHFKTVNDDHGHGIGDIVLVEAVQRLLEVGIPATAIARWGGEEFLLVLPNTTPASVYNTAQKVRSTIADMPFCAENRTVSCTVSIGVATTNPSMVTLKDLLRHTDHALYQAKHAGRNTVCAHEPEISN